MGSYKMISGLFSAAFGILVISVGFTWLLKSFGVLPDNLDPLKYALPVCIILIGAKMLLSGKKDGKQNS